MRLFDKKENLLIVCILAIVSAFVFFSVTRPREITIANGGNIFSFFKNPFARDSKNILILGMTGSGNNGSLLTDAILLVNMDFTRKKINLISVPRDLLVQIPNTSRYVKINGLLAEDNANRKAKKDKNGVMQWFNIEKWGLIKTKVEEITALKVDNVAVVDLDGFRYFIDALGGINVYLDKAIADPNLNNPDEPGEIFKLEAGWNYLDGKKAAKFVRSRFGPTGDFYRIGHQHDLLAAIFQKLKSLNKLSNVKSLLEIWNSWKGYLFTDVSINDGIGLAKFGNDLNSDAIKFITISYTKPDQLLINPGQSDFGYILTPKEGVENYTGIREYIQQKINEK